jgi:hypothetical protein
MTCNFIIILKDNKEQLNLIIVQGTIMKWLYKNWIVHNMIAHPLMQLVMLVSFGKLSRFSDSIHDVTIPVNIESDK